MPVLNESPSVEQAVEAALEQTHAQVEILVLDGRSADDTRARVRRMAERDPRVTLLDNPAGGISSALNIGLAAARGEFIARLDGHATVNEEYLATGVAHLRGDPGLAAVGGQRVGVAETATGRAIAVALSSPFGVGDSINHYATTTQETDHASFGVYRTSVARDVGGWDEDLVANEDVDFDLRILRAGHRLLYDPSMTIRWQVRETIRDLGRQYRRYGRGKGAMIAKNGPGAARPRHLAAPALVLSVAAAAALAGSGRARLALALAAPYGVALAGATGVAARRVRTSSGTWEPASVVTLPAAFGAMHMAWGLGFLEGLAGMRPAASSQSRPPVDRAAQQGRVVRDGSLRIAPPGDAPPG